MPWLCVYETHAKVVPKENKKEECITQDLGKNFYIPNESFHVN